MPPECLGCEPSFPLVHKCLAIFFHAQRIASSLIQIFKYTTIIHGASAQKLARSNKQSMQALLFRAPQCRVTRCHWPHSCQSHRKTPVFFVPWSRLILCLAESLSYNYLLFFSQFYNFHISGFILRPWSNNEYEMNMSQQFHLFFLLSPSFFLVLFLSCLSLSLPDNNFLQ